MNLWEIYHKEIPPFLQALSQAESMLRLWDVGMNCGCEYTAFAQFSQLQPYSRLEHSMGVALIVWHFTQDKLQAVAGLLHDIATPVFAHVVDFLNGDYMTQESTEEDTRHRILSDLQLRQLLAENGIPAEQVTDYHLYPVADNDAPGLAADRLEYTLGNAVNYGFITRQEAAQLYGDLCVNTNEHGSPELMFQSRDKALIFARLALRCSKIYVSPEDRYAMQMLSELLRSALQDRVLTKTDLYTRETPVIEKLKKSHLASCWQQFCGYRQILCRQQPEDGDGWRQIFAKKRYIDPYVQGQGRICSLEPDFAKDLDDFLAQPQTCWIKGVQL